MSRYYSYVDTTVGLGNTTVEDMVDDGAEYGIVPSVDIVARNITATGNFIGELTSADNTFVDIRVTGIATIGIVTGATYYGDGSNLTGVGNTDNIKTNSLVVIGFTTLGSVSASSYFGDGSNLTGTVHSISAGSSNITISGSNGILTIDAADSINLTDLSAQTLGPGTSKLTYNNTSGVFSYTPPNLSAYLITETDPVFSAAPASGITNTNISNWNTAYGWGNHALAGYLTSYGETDPVFSASPASGITNTNISNWDEAYGWGNHALAGYLKSFAGFTETDPVFGASPAGGITNTDISNWDTAYGWGNHALAGYLMSYTETDPVFIASPAGGINSTDITNWDEAYGWGNHADRGYLTNETDPIFVTSDAFGITAGDISNWNTAYGWGNHALAGYLTSETDPVFIASPAGSITQLDINNWNSSSGITLSDFSVSKPNASPSGDGDLTYNSSTGAFTYTPPLFRGGTGIIVDDLNAISVESTIARSTLSTDSLNAYVGLESGRLKSYQSDTTAGTLTIQQGGITKGTFNGSNTTISIDASSPSSNRIHCDIRNYYTNNWTTAFNDCLSANDTVYFPAGTYDISGIIGKTSNGSARIYGDGSGESIVNFSNGGFNFVGSQTVGSYNTFIIENLGITGTGTNAVRIEYVNNGGVTQKAYCNDVAVTGTWTTGFRLCNTDLSTFDNCSVYRPSGYEGVGVEVTVDDSSQGGTDPVNIRFNNWQIAGLDTAFKVNSQSEGIYFHDNLIIACKVGMSLDGNVNDNEAAEPYYIIRGNNIDVWKNCVRIDGLMQCVITDNSFYKFQTGPQNENWKGIIMDGNSYDNIITDNIFNGNINNPATDASTYWGVHLKRSIGASFSNNTFISLDLAFKLDETSQNAFNKFVDNTYRVVTQHFNTFSSGNSLATEFVTRGNLLSERVINNDYHMINGGGFYIYDSSNINGFKIGPDTRSTLQALKTAVGVATDFASLKAAIIDTL
jgi:hypothetical protein